MPPHPASSLSMTPGMLLHLAAPEGIPSEGERGFPQEFCLNFKRGRPPVFPGPSGVDRRIWTATAEPWGLAFARAVEPLGRLEFARFRLSAEEVRPVPDNLAATMDADWRSWAAAARELVCCSGFWVAGPAGMMNVNISIDLSMSRGARTAVNGRMNLGRDLRLQQVLTPALLPETQRLLRACPEWFLKLEGISMTVETPQPTQDETRTARSERPFVTQLAAAKLPVELLAHPAGWTSGKTKLPDTRRVYSGWDDFVDWHCHFGIHRSSMGRLSWMPSGIVFLIREYQDRFSAAIREQIDAWCAANCSGRYRGMWSGVHEFEITDDAAAFLARWGDVEGDTEGF